MVVFDAEDGLLPRRMRRAASAAAGLLTAALVASPLAAQAPAPRTDPRVAAALDSVSPARMADYLRHLVDFQTRNTMSINTPKEGWGIGAARQYILSTFRSFSPRLQADLDCYEIPPQLGRITEQVQLCNVVAILPGRSPRRIYVSGHYDSVARQEDGSFDWGKWQNTAPGANDDGSGTVLTMELARVLSQSGMDLDATLVFVAFAGEEEGLVGATLHAQKADRENYDIDGVFNNDIIGNSQGGNGIVDSRTVRVFSEGPMDSPSRELARYVRRWAAAYVPGCEVRLIAREDRFGRGGDHTAFNQHGFPGIRFTESRENYGRQHAATDVYEGVDFDYLARNTRVDGAAVATMALAPVAPVVDGPRGPRLDRGESGYDARMHWDRSPGAVGYRVVWRDAWTPDWQHELYVGDVNEAVLPDMSIDDYVYGVAAVDAQGHESVVTPFVRAPRGGTEIKEVGGG